MTNATPGLPRSTDPTPEIRLDPLMPAETAAKAEDIGVRKARMATLPMFLLAVLAGAFIALAAAFSTTAVAGTGDALPFGIVKLIAGITFSLGLILVVLGSAELFTGSNLISVAWASNHITTRAVLRNWTIVWTGNLVGSLATAALIVIAGQYQFGGGAVGQTALDIAASKVALDPLRAFTLAILCNGLVCLAIWLTYSARTTVDKIFVIVPPVAAFVAMGFEHSVANMYFIPRAPRLSHPVAQLDRIAPVHAGLSHGVSQTVTASHPRAEACDSASRLVEMSRPMAQQGVARTPSARGVARGRPVGGSGCALTRGVSRLRWELRPWPGPALRGSAAAGPHRDPRPHLTSGRGRAQRAPPPRPRSP